MTPFSIQPCLPHRHNGGVLPTVEGIPVAKVEVRVQQGFRVKNQSGRPWLLPGESGLNSDYSECRCHDNGTLSPLQENQIS
jgi:hypothetical protein